MHTLIRTKCPSCQTYCSVLQSQLNERDAKVRCRRCQQIFLANNNIVSDNSALPIDSSSKADHNRQGVKHSTSNPKEITSPKNQDDFLFSDTMIYDDMPINDLENTSMKYNSLDDMEPWFSLLDAMPSASSKDAQASKQTHKMSSHNLIKNDELVRNDLDNLVVKENYITKSTMSSAAANDIQVSVNYTDKRTVSDNVWLEKLLQDEDNNHYIGNDKSTTDLSKLLTSMGVPANDQKQLKSQSRLNRHADEQLHHRYQSPSRYYPVQNLLQASAASVLWLAGCLVLVMLLFAQYVIFNLDHLIKNPAHAARLQAVCAIALCSLPNADLTAFDIDNLVHKPSGVKAADEFSDISATLVNQSVQAQLLPSLRVGIYSDEALIGEFVASPEDYLASTQHRLPAEQNKSFMFTVPVVSHQISQITIDPIY